MPAAGGGFPGSKGYLIDASPGRMRIPNCEAAFVPAKPEIDVRRDLKAQRKLFR